MIFVSQCTYRATVDLRALAGETFLAWWLHPERGAVVPLAAPLRGSSNVVTLQAPDASSLWILVIHLDP